MDGVKLAPFRVADVWLGAILAVVGVAQPAGHWCRAGEAREQAERDRGADSTPIAEKIVLQRASSHAICYYLSLPKDWRPQTCRLWPVLICVAGADADFRGTAEKFRKARGEFPFLIVAPCTFSNANWIHGEALEHYRRLYPDEEIERAGGHGLIPDVNRRLDWDEAGLLAIIEDLEANYNASPRVYLTGFSGGGCLAYRMIVRRPDHLAAAAPVCPNFNFWNHGYRSQPGPCAPEAKALPIRVLTGERDPLRCYRFGGAFLPSPPIAISLAICLGAAVGCLVWRRSKKPVRAAAVAFLGVLLAGVFLVDHWAGIDVQTESALQLLKDLGYTNVERSSGAALGHEPAADQVVRAFAPFLQTSPAP
jgi:hypothetical protein